MAVSRYLFYKSIEVWFSRSVPKFVGFSVAGIGILFFIGILAVVMLILSLIPIYSSNNSNSGYGESN